MFTLTLSTILLTAAADPQTKPAREALPTPPQTRQATERGIDFLEKQGVQWMETRKCGSCHHAPMMLWSHSEAKKRGFAIKQKSLDEVALKAIQALKLDPEKVVAGTHVERLQMALGLGAMPAPAPEAVKTLDALAARLRGIQEKDGSWKLMAGAPPIRDSEDAATMLTLFALAPRSGPASDDWVKQRDKALSWLKTAPLGETNQSLVLRILTTLRFGKADDAQPLVKQLLSKQNADGGWSQKKDKPSDAAATGQTLYALSAAGKADDPAVPRAWGFLLKTQEKDGSWPVASMNSGKKNVAIVYYGSGWATMGLMSTMAKTKEHAK